MSAIEARALRVRRGGTVALRDVTALVAVVQASLASAVAFGLLGLDVEGSVALVVALAVSNAVLGMALGLFLSAFASTEFQAVQFMPAVILPQLLLCGLIVPRDLMAPMLDGISSPFR